MTDIARASMLSQFTCLGDRCEDTCCQGWSMQVDEATVARYRKEAPELADAVEPSVEAPWIMRKNTQGFCVKLENGLCGIHKKYGSDFLGDACYFYPRITRRLGDQPVMTASLSCPEIARLALFADGAGDACTLNVSKAERLPRTMKDCLPPGMSAADALAIHNAFLQACNSEDSPERIFARINSVSRSLDLIDRASWSKAVPFYLSHADARLPAPEGDVADPFNLLHALCGLIVASHKTPSSRLQKTVAEMEQALAVKLDWQNARIETSPHSAGAYARLSDGWQREHARYAPLLRRYLRAQLSLALYPFAGLGDKLAERISIIGVRLATIKLALMCIHGISGPEVTQDMALRVVQSLSRFLDHLGDSGFSLQIYGETGWLKEARMRGMLED